VCTRAHRHITTISRIMHIMSELTCTVNVYFHRFNLPQSSSPPLSPITLEARGEGGVHADMLALRSGPRSLPQLHCTTVP
jgi:hypothetical protein